MRYKTNAPAHRIGSYGLKRRMANLIVQTNYIQHYMIKLG
jgi:hypothetical protein